MLAPAMMTRWLGRGRCRCGGEGGGGGGGEGGGGASATVAPSLANTGLGPSLRPTWAL